MEQNNVIIISNTKSFAKSFANKILLLRKSDTISVLNYKEANSKLNNQNSSLILVHIEDEHCLDFVKQLRILNNFKNSSIIMIANCFDGDFLCKAFDSGIDDFVSEDIDETSLNMRIMWALKKNLLKNIENRNSNLLSLIEITDKQGFYQKPYTQMLFEREYKKCITKYEKTIFMIISPDISCKNDNTTKDISQILYTNLRKNDLCGLGPDNKFYLMLYKTDENGARTLFQKINDSLSFEKTISASAKLIQDNETFKEIERLINKKLSESLNAVNTFSFIQNQKNSKKIEKTQTENNIIIENPLKNTKKIKYIQNDFAKKMEKIISPIFFKMQAIYEPKLFDTDILQIFNNTDAEFIIKKDNNKSEIIIKYGTDCTLEIEITETFKRKTHSELVKLTQENINEEKIETIIQTVAETFRKNLYKTEEENLL